MTDTENVCALHAQCPTTTSSEATSQAAAVELTEPDIPGVCLDKPMNSHTMPQLKWWPLCRGIKAPSLWKNLVVDR